MRTVPRRWLVAPPIAPRGLLPWRRCFLSFSYSFSTYTTTAQSPILSLQQHSHSSSLPNRAQSLILSLQQHSHSSSLPNSTVTHPLSPTAQSPILSPQQHSHPSSLLNSTVTHPLSPPLTWLRVIGLWCNTVSSSLSLLLTSINGGLFPSPSPVPWCTDLVRGTLRKASPIL